MAPPAAPSTKRSTMKYHGLSHRRNANEMMPATARPNTRRGEEIPCSVPREEREGDDARYGDAEHEQRLAAPLVRYPATGQLEHKGAQEGRRCHEAKLGGGGPPARGAEAAPRGH